MTNCYTCFGASTGQISAQAPHEIQSSSFITYCVSPTEIQVVGQTPAQAPHEMQVASIEYAIFFSFQSKTVANG